MPVDVELHMHGDHLEGTLYAMSQSAVTHQQGFHVTDWQYNSRHSCSACHWSARIASA
jgi:hypothetical protein